MNFYRKYLTILILSIIAGFIFHFILFLTALGHPMEQERYLNEWFYKKDAYANSISGKKIMFISGSNTLFGVDAERIEKTLDIPTVNYGVHAGLNYYILERAKKHLKTGDIVILPLEYCYYTWHHGIFGEEFSAYLIGYDSTEIKKLTLSDKLKFVAQQNTKVLAKFIFQRIIFSHKNRIGIFESIS